MKVADVSPVAVGSTLLVVGLALGFVGAKLSDILPARYGIEHLVTGRKRTIRNAAIIALSGALGLALATRFVGYPTVDLGLLSFQTSVHLVLGVMLISGAATDLEHMILPDEITFGGALIGVATAYFRPVGIVTSLVGALIGFLVSYVPFLLYKWVRGRSGMGLGDAKLLVMIGAWLGWKGALFAMLAGSIQSVLVAIGMRIAGVSYGVPESVVAELAELRAQAEAGDEEAKAALEADPMAADPGEGLLATRLPMGPFLGLGALEGLLGGRHVDALWAWILG